MCNTDIQHIERIIDLIYKARADNLDRFKVDYIKYFAPHPKVIKMFEKLQYSFKKTENVDNTGTKMISYEIWW